MISYLTGQPLLHDQQLTVLVNGVGYQVSASNKVLQKADQSNEISLHIYTHVREDALSLFGFLSFQEKQLFELILGVSGVGPAIALHLIDRPPEQLIEAIQEAKISFFTAVPRVGKKLAQKIIIDLGGKLGQLKQLNLKPLSAKEQTTLDALLALGFEENQAREAVDQLNLDKLEVETAVKQAIQQLGSTGSP